MTNGGDFFFVIFWLSTFIESNNVIEEKKWRVKDFALIKK